MLKGTKHFGTLAAFTFVLILTACLPVPSAKAATFGITRPNYLNYGLVGHWTFDGKDVQGGTIRDISGNGNHGGARNIATSTFYTTGKVGQAVRFDGVDDYVVTALDNQLDGISQVTISAWMKKGSGDNIAVGRENAGFTDGVNIQYYNSGDGNVYFAPSTPGYGYVAFKEYNKWHHCVMVFDGILTGDANRLKGYIDGVQRSLSFAAAIPATTETMTVPFLFGTTNFAFTSEAAGLIDDVRVYNRALSAQEITQLYNLGR